jgi:hypothetical protein
MNNEHNDKPRQTRKRKMKLKVLISNIAMGGANAPEIVKARIK